MSILTFHRDVLREIQHLQCLQAETNNLLRRLVKILEPRYGMSVKFEPSAFSSSAFEPFVTQENNLSTTGPSIPTDTSSVGQITVGFPAETITHNGVTGAYPFNPAHIVWTLADPSIASFVVDATTGQATFTALAAGSTTGTVTDSDTKATDAYDLVVTPAAVPDTFTLAVAFQSATAPSGPTA